MSSQHLGVGVHVRILDGGGFYDGMGGVITAVHPAREVSTPSGMAFTALEDFTVALRIGYELKSLRFSGDELAVI